MLPNANQEILLALPSPCFLFQRPSK